MDVKQSILDNLNEKISSPLVGGFIASWAVWNYKTIFVLLSTKSVESKFQYIEFNIYYDWWSIPLYGLILPLLTSIAIILALPKPERKIHKYWHKHKKLLRDDKQEIDAEKLLSKAESRELTRRIINIESEHDEEIEKKNAEIKELKSIIFENEKQRGTYGLSTSYDLPKQAEVTKVEIEDSNDELLTIEEGFKRLEALETEADEIADYMNDDELDETIDKVIEVPNELSEDELEIFIIIEKEDYPIRDSVIEQMKYGKTKSEYILNKFIEKGYIESKHKASIGRTILKLTQKGIEYGIDNGLIV